MSSSLQLGLSSIVENHSREQVSQVSRKASALGSSNPETVYSKRSSALSLETGDYTCTWDVAVRYQDLKSQASSEGHRSAIRRLAVEAILRRAQNLIRLSIGPTSEEISTWEEVPASAIQPELALDETIEDSNVKSPLLLGPIWMNFKLRRKKGIILCLDTSLSMKGEKLALTAVAIAVVLLQFEANPVAILGFDQETHLIKGHTESLSPKQVIERFIDLEPRGYTNLEAGLLECLNLTGPIAKSARTRRPTVVLLTDGQYTAGRDPAYLAARFPHLVVLKTGQNQSGMALCRELAKKGGGRFKEIKDAHHIPQAAYHAVNSILRGCS